jgi:hypothetical protein
MAKTLPYPEKAPITFSKDYPDHATTHFSMASEMQSAKKRSRSRSISVSEKPKRRMISNMSLPTLGNYDEAVGLVKKGMRLVCAKGPGCKNHDWRKAGHKTHTKVSHHHTELSQPVGGGFQYTVHNKKHCSKRDFSHLCDQAISERKY